MSDLKRHSLMILMAILILFIIPMSFASDFSDDTNTTLQIDDVGNVEEELAAYDSDKLSKGYDFECIPNETEINYVLGTSYPVYINYTDTSLDHMTLLYAYINGDNTPRTIKTPSGFDIYEGSGHGTVDIKSISPYLSVGENTVVFHPTDSAMAYANLVNNHYVPIKINAIEPETPPTVYYVDSSIGADGDGHEGSTFSTLVAAISYANQRFSDEGGSIIIKRGTNGIYSESSTMNIAKNITISAEEGAHVTVTSTNDGSLFSQSTKADVTISGITFKDMQITFGAIYYQNTNAVDGSTLIIQNCSFINNEAPTLVRLYKTQATIKHVNFIENTVTATGVNGGLVNYAEGGGSRWAPSPYKFDISYCNIIGNENSDYVFTGSTWQCLTANNNYCGSNYSSKPTGIYNRENDNYGDGNSLLTLDNWVFLDIAMSDGEISAGSSYPITFDFKQNDGSALADNMADLDVIISANGIINPSNLTISGNHAETTYIAPKMINDKITVKCGSTTIYSKNIVGISSDFKYMSTPTVDSVEYLIGENKNITIGIISDVEFSSSDKLYVYVGETEIDVGVLANENLFTIDLKSISDKFAFDVGQDYTLYFHPKISTLTGKGINNSEYLFNPLTVSVTGEYNPEPQVVYTSTPKVGDKTAVEYSDDLVVSVNIVYDESSLSQSKINALNSGNMMMFINGDRTGIAIAGVNSASKSFTVNLVDFKDKLTEGKNTISFHPATSLLESVFGTHDIVVLNNLTVNFVTPEPPYVSTPYFSYITYTKTTSCNVRVTVTGAMVSYFNGSSMYMYIDGVTSGIRLDGVNSDANRFTVDLSDYDSYFTAGKTYSIVFHPSNDLFGQGNLPGLDECEFNPIIVTVKPAPQLNYVSTPNETAVNYVFGESKKIRVNIDSDILPSLEQCYVYAWVNGEGSNDRFLIYHVKGSDSSFTFDLADISSKLKEGVNTVTFHVDPDFIEEATWSSDTYKFNPLIVYASFEEANELFYTNYLIPNSIAEYENGTSQIIRVTANYNETKASSFGYRLMYIYINGQEIAISGVYANSTSFTIDLMDYTEYFVEGQNNISIHPQIKALKDAFQAADETRFEFADLTVNVIPAKPQIKYTSTPAVDGSGSVQYLIGENATVIITVSSALLDYFDYDDEFYAWIGDDYKSINIMANEASATVDLKLISDEFGFEEGQNYTIYFHPDINDLNSIGVKEGEYVFNPLTVEIIGTYAPEPVVYTSTPKVGDNTTVNYIIGEETIVTVTVVYDESSYGSNSGFNGKNMKIFINGDKTGTDIGDVRANATSFTVNLAYYITEEGSYDISFGPDESTLSSVFYGVDNYVAELKKLFVTAGYPKPIAKTNYTIIPSPIEVDYIIGDSSVINVSVEYNSSFADDLGKLPIYIYINDKMAMESGVKANVTSFEFDFATISEYLTVGRNVISFYPKLDELSSIGNVKCEFGNVTVNAKNAPVNPNSTYLTIPIPSTVDYTLNESSIVTVTVIYDDYFRGNLSVCSMFVYINGEDMANSIKIQGIYGNETTFIFDLKEISDKLVEGQNNLTFHPYPEALEGLFAGPYIYYNLTVNVAATPEPINPVDAAIDISVNNVTEGETAIIEITLPKDATGVVLVDIGDKKLYAELAGGKARVNVDGLEAGEYTASVRYLGDDNHSAVASSFRIKVDAKDKPAVPSIVADAVSAAEGEAAVVGVTLPGDASGLVLVDVADNKYYGEVKGGKANVSVGGLSAGNYTADVTYLGDDKYAGATTTVAIKVDAKEGPITPALESPDVNITLPSDVTAGNALDVKVQLPSDATGNVTFKVDGKEIAALPLTNGSASVSLPALGGGIHAVEVEYSGDDKYAPATAAKAVESTKKATHIEAQYSFTRIASDYFVGERGALHYVYLKDEDGNPVVNRTVQVAVNGPIYNITTDNLGRAGLQINLAAANTYTYAISFQGDDEYLASPLGSSKLILTKKSTSIAASNKAFNAKAKTKTVSVTLKTIKNPYNGKTYLKAGKKITLKINGKTYTAKTNAKGVAKFTIKLVKKGKYAAVIKFAGDKTYKASSKKIKVTIK